MGFPKSILVSFLKDYHKGDINLFWEDIRLNSIKRVQNYFKNLQSKGYSNDELFLLHILQ